MLCSKVAKKLSIFPSLSCAGNECSLTWSGLLFSSFDQIISFTQSCRVILTQFDIYMPKDRTNDVNGDWIFFIFGPYMHLGSVPRDAAEPHTYSQLCQSCYLFIYEEGVDGKVVRPFERECSLYFPRWEAL